MTRCDLRNDARWNDGCEWVDARLADGLGVEVSPHREEYFKQWIGGPAAEQEWLFKRKG